MDDDLVESDFLTALMSFDDEVKTAPPPPPRALKVKPTEEATRKAGSIAFFELKKYKFFDQKQEGDRTNLHLFGDQYVFHMDVKMKALWMVSKHHYQQSSNFKLATRHREWEGIFSFPREIVANAMKKYFDEQNIEVSGAEPNRKMGIQYRIVANQVYKGDKHKLARIFGGILWKMIDREIACLAMKVFGLSASSLDYTLIWNNKEEILDTIQKAPGILPLWRDIILVKMYNNRVEGLRRTPPRSRRGGAYEAVNPEYPGQIASSFNYAEDASTLVFPNIIDTVKKHLEGHGLTKAAWRYLLKIPPRTMMLLTRGLPGREIVALLNWLAAVGVVPRYSLVKPMIQNTFIQMMRTDDSVAFLRAALTAAQESKAVRAFWTNELHLAMDWFCNGGERRIRDIRPEFNRPGAGLEPRVCNQVALDHNQRKASWEWFMRQQQEWHRTASNRAKEKVENDSWESAIGEIEIKGYTITPLTTAHQLVDEGKEMHHCVGSYAEQCKMNRSRIFSIRKGKAKVATLELTDDIWRRHYPGSDSQMPPPSNWKVNQLRGACNSNPPDDVKGVAETVARKYNKAVAGTHFAQEPEAVAS